MGCCIVYFDEIKHALTDLNEFHLLYVSAI